MAGELNETVWITLMHEMQSFVRQNLEQPHVMAELRHLMGPQPLKKGPARPDIKPISFAPLSCLLRDCWLISSRPTKRS